VSILLMGREKGLTGVRILPVLCVLAEYLVYKV
jgi:hypothetical protein